MLNEARKPSALAGTRIRVLALALLLSATGLLVGGSRVAHAYAAVSPATGATEMVVGTPAELAGPYVTEGAPGDISAGSITLQAPPGFEFDTTRYVTAAVTNTGDCVPDEPQPVSEARSPAQDQYAPVEPEQPAVENRPLLLNGGTSQTVAPSPSQVTVDVTQTSSGGCTASIAWSGIGVVAISPGDGAITKAAGGSVISGVADGATSFGYLSATAPVQQEETTVAPEPVPEETTPVDPGQEEETTAPQEPGSEETAPPGSGEETTPPEETTVEDAEADEGTIEAEQDPEDAPTLTMTIDSAERVSFGSGLSPAGTPSSDETVVAYQDGDAGAYYVKNGASSRYAMVVKVESDGPWSGSVSATDAGSTDMSVQSGSFLWKLGGMDSLGDAKGATPFTTEPDDTAFEVASSCSQGKPKQAGSCTYNFDYALRVLADDAGTFSSTVTYTVMPLE